MFFSLLNTPTPIVPLSITHSHIQTHTRTQMPHAQTAYEKKIRKNSAFAQPFNKHRRRSHSHSFMQSQ